MSDHGGEFEKINMQIYPHELRVIIASRLTTFGTFLAEKPGLRVMDKDLKPCLERLLEMSIALTDHSEKHHKPDLVEKLLHLK